MRKPTIVGRPRPAAQLSIFDERPIELPGVRLCARRVEFNDPTLEECVNALGLAYAAEESSAFWIGDLWNYLEGQAGWREQLPQKLADLGVEYAVQTFYNSGSVARKVTGRARQAAPSFGHASVVADLEDDEQVELLERARDEGLSVRELMNVKRQRKRPTIIEGQAALDGMYRVIYADPPWLYGNRQPSGSGAIDHFPPMTIKAICDLPVEAHALPSSVLFCWVTAPMLYENPGPREVIEAWGFRPKTGMVWDKVLHNYGHYVSARHEHLIIATRGSCLPDAIGTDVDSVQTIRRGDVHSAKPEDFRRIIEKLYTTGPYLELFGREPRAGWSVFGNDARLWGRDARVSYELSQDHGAAAGTAVH